MYQESGGGGDASLFAGGGFMPSQAATGNEFSSSVSGASRVRTIVRLICGSSKLDRACKLYELELNYDMHFIYTGFGACLLFFSQLCNCLL